MARVVRAEIFDPAEVSVFHCINRCVRRCFLFGDDPVSGRSFKHRRAWLEERLEFLASVFGIDILGFAVMSNHFHVILRNRPEVVAAWSDAEVAARWWRLHPLRKEDDGTAADPTDAELSLYLASSRLAEIRRRLADISWFMRSAAEPLARRANAEDRCTGRFWEGRFKSVKLCDEAAILACSIYVDLNPIRAGVALTPETSEHTSAQRRIEDLKTELAECRQNPQRGEDALAPVVENEPVPETSAGRAVPNRPRTNGRRAAWSRSAVWLAPVMLNERGAPGPAVRGDARRASDKGFLPVSLPEYLRLLDWTGRQSRRGKPGVVPVHLESILERVGLPAEHWLALSLRFGKLFRRRAGRPTTLARERARAPREGRPELVAT